MEKQITYLKIIVVDEYLNFTYVTIFIINPLMPGGNKKDTYTYTNLQLSAAGLFKDVWRFCYHQALKGYEGCSKF